MDNMDVLDDARLISVAWGGSSGRKMGIIAVNPGIDMRPPGRYAGSMTESASYRDGRARAGEPGTVGGLLTTALTMEDQISNGVYEEYLDRAKWPAGLDDATFLLIKERLTTLINDTRQHNKILQALMEQHAKSK